MVSADARRSLVESIKQFEVLDTTPNRIALLHLSLDYIRQPPPADTLTFVPGQANRDHVALNRHHPHRVIHAGSHVSDRLKPQQRFNGNLHTLPSGKLLYRLYCSLESWYC